jgi:hypothetical protein
VVVGSVVGVTVGATVGVVVTMVAVVTAVVVVAVVCTVEDDEPPMTVALSAGTRRALEVGSTPPIVSTVAVTVPVVTWGV